MTYKEVYPEAKQFLKALDQYALENDCVDDSYHLAKRFYNKMFQKSYVNEGFLQVFDKWLRFNSTLTLRDELLPKVGYLNSNLKHFNAMTLLDTVVLKHKI